MTRYGIGTAVLIAIGVARIAATYPVLSETYDEPLHLANGMEWLQVGTFTNQYLHPPLAGIVTALGPYLHGLRSSRRWNPAVQGESVVAEDGNEILYSNNDYWRNLTLARIGTLPFFVLACIVVFLWARRWFRDAAGFWAALLLVCTSPVLGHAGVATNDVACTAGVALSLYCFVRWLEQPDGTRWIAWGAATGFAIVCKFSSIPFLTACYIAGFAIWAIGNRGKAVATLRLRGVQVFGAGVAALLLMWACYRFTLIPLAAVYGPHPKVDAILSSRPLLRGVWNTIMAMPLPLTQVIMGVRDLYRYNTFGQDSYLLGQWSLSGWWYFFPVVLAVKTPVGLLLLALSGFWIILHRWKETGWQQLLTLVFPLAILVVCISASIDLGVRHILPAYAFLAVIAGEAVAEMFRHSRITMAAAAILVAWVAADSVRAHPDYLAHFNEFGGAHPENILCESDLDWGQDMHRLQVRLKERGIQEVSIAYFGSALLHKSDLPHYELLSPTQPSRGYIAISLHHLNMEYAKNGSFAWLKPYTPIERIGKSIDLFYIP